MATTKSKKATKAVVIKAHKVKQRLSKTKAETVSATRGIATAAAAPASKLSHAMLTKRQAAKGVVRKKGGAKLAKLTQEKLRSLSHHIEAGPTQAE
jgi:hypothetical protein